MNNASPISNSLRYVPISSNIKTMGGEPILRIEKNKADPCAADTRNLIILRGSYKDAAQHKRDLASRGCEVVSFCGMNKVAFLSMQDGGLGSNFLYPPQFFGRNKDASRAVLF